MFRGTSKYTPISFAPEEQKTVQPIAQGLDKDELFDYLKTNFQTLNDALTKVKQEAAEVAPSSVKPAAKTGGGKKKYAQISDSMYSQLKGDYPELTKDVKVLIDNNNELYLDNGRKKLPLNHVNFLNTIKK